MLLSELAFLVDCWLVLVLSSGAALYGIQATLAAGMEQPYWVLRRVAIEI